MKNMMRLDKFLSEAGVASRKDIKNMVRQGRVTVNGVKAAKPEDKVDEVLAYFEELKLISQCHGKRLRYPTIKKWFLARYPEVAEFGMEPVADEDPAAAQEPIPFAPNATTPEAAELKESA